MRRMRRPAFALLLAVALGLVPAGGRQARAAAPAGEGPGCGAPAEFMDAAPLPGAFAGVSRGELRIMVVGSASSASGGTSSPAATWPRRLEARLTARLGGVAVQVETFGGRGTTAAEHARILAREVPGFRPHLVIWQLGTVEAARGLPVEEMSEAVDQAASRLRATRGEQTDLVLMDMQFSRFFRTNANVEPYRDELRIAAAAAGGQFFSRWDLMRHWVEAGRLDLERAPRGGGIALADELHDCIARVLAAFVLEGAQRNLR